MIQHQRITEAGCMAAAWPAADKGLFLLAAAIMASLSKRGCAQVVRPVACSIKYGRPPIRASSFFVHLSIYLSIFLSLSLWSRCCGKSRAIIATTATCTLRTTRRAGGSSTCVGGSTGTTLSHTLQTWTEVRCSSSCSLPREERGSYGT